MGMLAGMVLPVVLWSSELLWLRPSLALAQQRITEATLGLSLCVRHESGTQASEGLMADAQQRVPAGYIAPLGRVFEVLRQAGLQPETAQYQPVTAGASGPEQLMVTVPLKGAYPAIRRALDRLVATSDVSIDALTMERKSVGNAQVLARVRLALRAERS
jgi:hypothetical protein